MFETYPGNERYAMAIIDDYKPNLVKNSEKIEFFSISKVLENIDEVGRVTKKSQVRQKEYVYATYTSYRIFTTYLHPPWSIKNK